MEALDVNRRSRDYRVLAPAGRMMADEYHELRKATEVPDESALKIPRAHELIDAIRRNRDYTLIQLRQHLLDGASTLECLIVDVECDGVPPKNSAGIRYRERLALGVPSDPGRLVEVLALRRDFPLLLHENQVAPNTPASLCLYFEAPAAVLRTWTPAAFLRRIQWWLTQSARGELHPADQPVEHLFFASKYELVVPWNLGELQKKPGARFIVVRREQRPDGSCTCFLEPLADGVPEEKERTAVHIEVTLPPIVHGLVEHDPVTLGQLADLLARRDVDLLGPLRAALQGRLGPEGVPVSADDKQLTVIVLHIPVRREQGSEPVGVTHRAFVALTGSLNLGVATGALHVHEGRYYREVFAEERTEWREEFVKPMDVLPQNDGGAARRQSGIVEAGPAAVLVGAGSLGSALLNVWGRAGWGHWTVIDNDHIKPHNLSRHTAYAQHVGEAKAAVAAALHHAVFLGATNVVPLVADATELAQPRVKGALSEAAFVVDASTTLEYPRAASADDALPRHSSVFITPDGSGSVLLLEDKERRQRLRTLEAQYYRALITSDWGKNHLSSHANTYWSGGSCRDISLVMPYSRVLVHASTLAEQIQTAAAHDNASIRVWQRDPVRGAVDVHDVPVRAEHRLLLGDLDVFIDEGLEEQLRELRRVGLPHETGGVLLGYHDFNIGAIVVVAALPAPPDSKAGRSFFERGVAGLAGAVADATARTAGMVNYIGEWHSHPSGHSASPSGHDFGQLAHLAQRMADDGLPAVQLIVAERDLRILVGKRA